MKRKIKWKNIFLIVMIVYSGYIFVTQQVTMNNIRNEISEKQTEEQKNKEKNQRLQDEVKMSKSDMYIEKLARERLGLIKQGETPVINNKN